MTSTMFLSLAAFGAVAWMGFLVYARATGLIGGAIAKRTQVIPETADEKFIFAGHPDYAGLRRQVMRAEQAAGMQ